MSLVQEFTNAVADIFNELDDIPVSAQYMQQETSTNIDIQVILDSNIQAEIASGSASAGDIKALVPNKPFSDMNIDVKIGDEIKIDNRYYRIQNYSLDTSRTLLTLIIGEL